jgi:hypothetical protein
METLVVSGFAAENRARAAFFGCLTIAPPVVKVQEPNFASGRAP